MKTKFRLLNLVLFVLGLSFFAAPTPTAKASPITDLLNLQALPYTQLAAGQTFAGHQAAINHLIKDPSIATSPGWSNNMAFHFSTNGSACSMLFSFHYERVGLGQYSLYSDNLPGFTGYPLAIRSSDGQGSYLKKSVDGTTFAPIQVSADGSQICILDINVPKGRYIVDVKLVAGDGGVLKLYLVDHP